MAFMLRLIRCLPLITALILFASILHLYFFSAEQPDPPAYPNDWAMRQRTFPHGAADKNAAFHAIAAAQQQRLHLRKSKSDVPQWEFIGPSNIGGRISDIEYNPVDPSIVYAAAATGGVFKSTDGGKSWLPIFDEQAVLPIGDLAVDPIDPQIVYAGTGEANGGHNNFPGSGVFKSTNAGQDWQHIGLTETTSISRIHVDPQQPSIVYVAAIGSYFGADEHRGVYKSENGGQSWKKVLFLSDSAGVIDLVIDPLDPQILFAAGWHRIRPATGAVTFSGARSGIYKSTDGGSSWLRLGAINGLPGPQTNIGRIGLTICAGQPEHLYALYTDGFYHYGLYRSKDGGENWTRVDEFRELQAGSSNLGWYLGQVRVDPDNPEKVFVLDVGLMGSEDGGKSWPIFHRSGPSSPHVDHHAMAFHPKIPGRILDGNDGGIYISDNGGFNWQKVPNLPITQFYHITHDPSNPERVFGGTQDNGTLRSPNGRTNNWQHILGGDGFYVIVDPDDPQVIYAESQFGGLAKSTNGARSWRTILSGINSFEPTNWSTPVIMDANDSQKLYYGTNSVYKTYNGGEQWRKISPPLGLSASATITTIAPAAADTAVLYAGTEDGQVWVTDIAGENWQNITNDLPYRWITRLRVDPLNPEIAYVTFSGLKWNSPQPHVFRTDDMGQTWTNISANLPDAPVNSILIDPADRNVLYVATDVGVFYSRNRGGIWQPLGEGMPVVSVYDLDIDRSNRYLLAGTHGRSMYRIPIDEITAVANDSEPPLHNFALAPNYPNPFNAGTRIAFTLLEYQQVSMKIYNIAGREIAELLHQQLPAGRHELAWDGMSASGVAAPSGIYFYRLSTASGQTLTRRMALVR